MKKLIPALGVALIAIAAVATTVAQGHAAKATAEVCVLLPDTKSSVRWEQFDRPLLGSALKKAGVSNVINNAQGDAQKQRDQADQCLANGAKVLILTQLDTGSAIAIQKAAAAKGAKSIDYDRQVDRRRRPGLCLVRQPRSRRAAGQGRRRGPQGQRQVRPRSRSWPS